MRPPHFHLQIPHLWAVQPAKFMIVPSSFTCLRILSSCIVCLVCTLWPWDLLHVMNRRSDIHGLQFLKTRSLHPTRVQDRKCIASRIVTTCTLVDFLPISTNGGHGVHASAMSLAGSNVCTFIIPQAHSNSKKFPEVIKVVIHL